MDRAGAPDDGPTQLSAREEAEIAAWERFLNGDSLKERLMSRYLYEHLFLAHLYLNDAVEGCFSSRAQRNTAATTHLHHRDARLRRPKRRTGLLPTAARS